MRLFRLIDLFDNFDKNVARLLPLGIQKVREYHYELTKDITDEERRVFYKKGADEAEKRIQEFRKTAKK